MQSKWINKENNDTLILIFMGWACDEQIIRDLRFKDSDIVCFFDYSDEVLDLKVDKQLNGYKNVVMLAWSFGVWVADFLYAKKCLPNIDRAYALNGTLKPIDNDYGIHEVSFRLTIKGLERVGLSKFYERMSSDTQLNQCSRSLKEQTDELKNLQRLSTQVYTSKLSWNGAMVGRKDLIFPPEKIENFWVENNVEVFNDENIEHFPFCKNGLKIINYMLNEHQ